MRDSKYSISIRSVQLSKHEKVFCRCRHLRPSMDKSVVVVVFVVVVVVVVVVVLKMSQTNRERIIAIDD